jgi:hypothetical protein
MIHDHKNVQQKDQISSNLGSWYIQENKISMVATCFLRALQLTLKQGFFEPPRWHDS